MSVQRKPSCEKTATVDLIKGHTPSFRLRRPDTRCVAMHHVYTVRKALSSTHRYFSSLMERKERTTLPKMSCGSARMRASSPSSRSGAADVFVEEVPSMRTRAGRGREGSGEGKQGGRHFVPYAAKDERGAGG